MTAVPAAVAASPRSGTAVPAAAVIAGSARCGPAGLRRRAGRRPGLRPGGRLAGEGQECLFQGGPAQGQPADLQAGGGEPGGHGGQDPGAVGDRQDDPARCLVDGRLPGAECGQRGCQLTRVLAGRGLQVQPVPSGPGPELLGCAAGDDLAVVDDDDRPGEPFGFLDVLGGQQHAGALRRQARRRTCHKASRPRGSRPVVGSSRNSTGGAASRLAATSRRRRMPPE